MAISTATVTIPDLSTYTGADYDPATTSISVTNTAEDGSIWDAGTGGLFQGGGVVSFVDNAASIEVPVPGGSNPSSWQTYIHLHYRDPATQKRTTRTFGPFTITESANLADLVEEQEVPPAYLTTVTAALDEKVAEAEAARDEAQAAAAAAVDISNIAVDDDIVDVLVRNAGGAGPKTNAAVLSIVRPRTVYLQDYCAEDGVTDDSAGILEAAEDLVDAGGGTLWFTPGKTYLVDDDVVINAAGVAIDVAGNGAVIQAGPTPTLPFHITGSMTQLAGGNDAYAETTIGSRTIATNNDLRSSVSVGDLLMVWSGDVDNAERPTDYLSGEPVRVVTISANQITTDRPIRLTHSIGKDRRLYKITPAKVKVSDLEVRAGASGSTQRLIEVKYADTVHIFRPIASGKNARYGISVNQCLNVRVELPQVTDMWDAANGSSGPLGYGISLQGCVGAAVVQPTGTRVRHVVDVNSYSSTTLPGFVSMDIEVSDGDGISTWAPAWSTHHARNVTFNRLRALGCGGGFIMRAVGWAIRDPLVSGGHSSKPSEWDVSRATAAAILVGETDSLPAGEGDAGSDVLIDNLRTANTPTNWKRIQWVDAPGAKVRITGPGLPTDSSVVVSDSANRADGSLGNPDLAYGYRPVYGDWEWVQSSAGVVISSGKFSRPTGSIASLRTSVDVGANVEASVTWDAVGSPENMVVLIARSDSSAANFYGAGVSADGTLTLIKRVSSSISNITASSSGAVVDGDRVALRVVGRHLQAVVNGKVVIEADDTALTATGRAGFFFRAAGGDGWAASKFVVRDLSPSTY